MILKHFFDISTGLRYKKNGRVLRPSIETSMVWYTFYSFFIKNQLQLQSGFELIISCQKSPIQVNLDASALSKLKLNAAKRQLTVPFFGVYCK